jgi:hypothetical protein
LARAASTRSGDRSFPPPAVAILLGKVDEFDLVGAADHGIGDRLALQDAGDLEHHVVERLEVLDVEGGQHVDAGVEKDLDVLPPLGVPTARAHWCGQFVDKHHLGRRASTASTSISSKARSR